MSTLFDAYLMVDWSSAKKRSTGANSIWFALFEPGALFAGDPSLDVEKRSYAEHEEGWVLGVPRPAAPATPIDVSVRGATRRTIGA